MEAPAAAPSRSVPVALRDGSMVDLRRSEMSDEAAVLDLLRSLTLHSRAMRFATTAVHLPLAARSAVEQDGVIAFAPDGRCVGHTWYVHTTGRRAEMAIVVADRYHGRGLGTILLRKLAELAALRGVDVLEAYVLFDNAAMTNLLRSSGFPVRARPDVGGDRFELDIASRAGRSADLGAVTFLPWLSGLR